MGLVVTSNDVKWNAVNLPVIYKITNTKFPVNMDDAENTISSITNNSGFSQITLASTAFTYQVKGKVKITGTTNYNGVWKIRSKTSSTVFTIDAPFVADETGTLQNYYDNYNTLVRVYAGLPEYHPSNSSKPMTLITDNPITIKPNSDNEAIIDVSALVKSKMNLDNDYNTQNDLNPFTAFFIEYSEQYDQSDGIDVNVITETYQTDLIDSCDDSASNFITNGTFDTDLTGWSQADSGQSWSVVSGQATVTLNISNRNSRSLSQSSLGLTGGTEYNLRFDYSIGTELVTIEARNNNTIFEETLTGSGTIDIRFIADESIDSIVFFYKLASSLVGDISPTLDNVVIVNVLNNPCINYRFAVHNALQPQNENGGNLTEYVQSFGSVDGSKWLTLFEQPVLFEGNYFDISSLIPQSVIQSAIQSGGYFIEIVEYNRNGNVIAENQIPITENLGDGVYRFRLDNQTFDSNTKKFTVQILRIPINLFVDGDQGTFDTTSDPTGNPPSDWSLEKHSKSVISFEDTIIESGTGALEFESRSIFDDNYGFRLQSTDSFNPDSSYRDERSINIFKSQITDFDITVDWQIEFEFILTELYDTGQQALFSTDLANLNGSYALVEVREKSFTTPSALVATLTIDSGTTIFYGLVSSIGSLIPNKKYRMKWTCLYNDTITLEVTDVETGTIFTDSKAVGSNEGADYENLVIGTATNFAGTKRIPRSIYQNLKLGTPLITEYHFKFNQDQGLEVYESTNSEFKDILDIDYSMSDLELNGGTWIDTTTIIS